MRDGVKLALDLYLPEKLAQGEKIPAILHQTRYFRSMELRWPWRTLLGGAPFDHTGLYAKRRKRFVKQGYAWVDVDVRGSGASYGHRICPWSPDEIRDGAEIVEWIVAQPWSSGSVGAMGISYDGTSAEFLLLNRHPAVKAIAPRFSLFDAYADIAFPGGVHNAWFTENWGRVNGALDRNAPHEIRGWWVKLFVTGVQPVRVDKNRSMRSSAVQAHTANYDVHEESLSLTFRDDVTPTDPFQQDRDGRLQLAGTPLDGSGSIGLFSPHNYVRDLEASGAAVYSYSGWLDGAYPHAAIKRFLSVRSPGSRLILGPWNHGGGWNVNPAARPSHSGFHHEAELLRFFDVHLKGIDTGILNEKPVRYYTMVEESWKASIAWPPPQSEILTLFFRENHLLSTKKPSAEDWTDTIRVDVTAGTGEQTRWRNQLAVDAPVRYAERSREDEKLLVYTSEPLLRGMEVTGHPIVTLYAASSANDGNFIVYLEDVNEKGRVNYVTEGQLRAIHRKLSPAEPPYRQVVPYRTYKREDAMPLVPGEVAELVFDLLPTSYFFRAGHSVRVAIAGADADQFAQPPGDPPTLCFQRNRLHPSRIDLPTIP